MTVTTQRTRPTGLSTRRYSPTRRRKCGTPWREDWRNTSKDDSRITTHSYLGEGVGRPGGRAREIQVRMIHVLQHILI